MAIQYESPAENLRALKEQNIRISKLHLSSALKVNPTPGIRNELANFIDDVYLHQVVAKTEQGKLQRWADLDIALEETKHNGNIHPEWRIHFHVPLHASLQSGLDTTVDHLSGVLDELGKDPALCSHLEFETYTWEVLPPNLKSNSVVDQLVAEYDWCFEQLARNSIQRENAC